MAFKFDKFLGRIREEDEGQKINLSSVMNNDASNYVSDLPLVTPVISPIWTITGIATPSTERTLRLEHGHVASLLATYTYHSASGKKNPTAVSASSSFSDLPLEGSASQPITRANITTNTSINATITAPASGLIVSGTRVVRPTSVTSTSATVSVAFYHRCYWGVSTKSSITSLVDLKTLNNELRNTRVFSLSNPTTASDEYLYIAYPKSLGALSGIAPEGGLSLLGAFTASEITVVNDPGKSVDYYVYRLNNIGAIVDSTPLTVS